MYTLIDSGDFSALLAYIVVRVSVTLLCWFFVICACALDFWSGVNTAKSIGERLMSHGFRRTITKIGDYWRVMFFALMFDILGAFFDFYILPFVTMLCTISVMWIEGKSVIENAARKRSHAAELPEALKAVIEATTSEEAQRAISQIIKLTKKHQKHGYNIEGFEEQQPR